MGHEDTCFSRLGADRKGHALDRPVAEGRSLAGQIAFVSPINLSETRGKRRHEAPGRLPAAPLWGPTGPWVSAL